MQPFTLKQVGMLTAACFAGMSLTLQANEEGGIKPQSDNSALKKTNGLEQQPYFVENAEQVTTPNGRVAEEVAFKASSGNVTLYFQEDRVSYVYPKREKQAAPDKPMKDSVWKTTGLYRMDMVLKGAHSSVKIQGQEPKEAFSRHFTGNGQALKANHFGKLVYEEVYEGIDLVYKYKDGRLKYEFVVDEGADASQIEMKYQGARNVQKQANGELLVTNPLGRLKEAPPVAYYKGERDEEVACEFVVDNTLSFELSGNANRPIVIDPYLSVSTFIGGSDIDQINDIAIKNSEGTMYVAGMTNSSAASFPYQSGKVINLQFNFRTL